MTVDHELLLTRPLSRRQLVGLDILVAAAYTLVLLAMVLGQSPADRVAVTLPMAVEAAIVLAMGIPIAARRRWPVPVLVTAIVATVAALVLGVAREGFVGGAWALYIVALEEDRPRRGLTLTIAGTAAIGLLLLVIAGSHASTAADLSTIVVAVVVLGGSWTIGRAVRERRRYAERSSAALVARAVVDERLRIARDLHDVVAHGLSLIVVRAGTANHVLDARPQEARDALRVIETTGRAALIEMRHLLDVLRSEGAAAEDAELVPAPGVGQLRSLADRVTAAGVPVELELVALDDLPDGVSLTVYRIVQEALTNVVRHAASARCHVVVRATGNAIAVEIIDDGLAAGGAGEVAGQPPGHGLIGMRERVRMLGGDFSAGPLPDRGFRVSARIPLTSGGSAAGGGTPT